MFEVRTTGADTNGGGFDSAAAGTDFSQQDSPQFNGTDLAGASANTATPTVTSAGHNFVSTDVGNFINISAGTNWTQGIYKIVSVAANAATLDRACASVASPTNGTWAEGGAFLTPTKALGVMVAGSKMYLKAGSYSKTTTFSLPNTASNTTVVIEGYNATRGDAPTGSSRPTLTSATNSINILTFQTGNNIVLKHLIISSTASTRGDGFSQSNLGYNIGLFLINVKISGCHDGFAAGTNVSYQPLYMENCEIASCTDIGIKLPSAQTDPYKLVLIDTSIHDCTSDGILHSANNVHLTATRCIFYNNGGRGVNDTAGGSQSEYLFTECVFASNTSDGFQWSSSTNGVRLAMRNCIIQSNGGWGVNVNTAATPQFLRLKKCAFRNNTSGTHQWASGATLQGVEAVSEDEITLTADPFVSAGTDFSLNNTAGGGAACRAAGFPGVLGYGGTGYIDVGALQHQDSGSVIIAPQYVQFIGKDN